MSESPFQSSGHPERNPAFNSIEEEDEDVTSPTEPNFRRSDRDNRRAPGFTQSRYNLPGEGTRGVGTFGIFGAIPFGAIASEREGEEEEVGRAGRPQEGGGFPSNYALGRRTSVSAESLNPSSSGAEGWVPPSHPKDPEQIGRLKNAVSSNFLFSHLDDEQSKTVLDALVEKPVPAKDIKVITQGDTGDYFYVVERGHLDVHIHPSGCAQPGPDGLGAKVTSIGPGGSFGELALMYNSPRAATVISTEPCTLWALDRVTFRRILMDSAFQRRRMYEAFLEEVPLLSTLKPYERAKIADALDAVKHPAGATIIAEGEPGNSFYLLESGEAVAYKSGIEGAVKQYKRGDYFGELALLDDKPRQATVVAKTEVKVAKLGRDGFKRLLGPVEEIMRRTEYTTPASRST
ncbi:hypothetical protein FQN57_004321 [Myotisia sp. PD_48]|nr:hypothetical protein FQN57_004321 [Myotisia sp. PD_48]